MKDQSKPKGTHGGRRKGAGKPKGTKNTRTLERDEALRQFRKRVQGQTDELLNAQMTLAKGYNMLFSVNLTSTGNPAGKPKLVTDKETVAMFIDNSDGEHEWIDPEEGTRYYMIVTTKPDNKAIDSLLNRTYGTAVQNHDLKSGGDKVEGLVLVVEDSPSEES